MLFLVPFAVPIIRGVGAAIVGLGRLLAGAARLIAHTFSRFARGAIILASGAIRLGASIGRTLGPLVTAAASTAGRLLVATSRLVVRAAPAVARTAGTIGRGGLSIVRRGVGYGLTVQRLFRTLRGIENVGERQMAFSSALGEMPLGLLPLIGTPYGQPLMLDYLSRLALSNNWIAQYLRNFIDEPRFYGKPERMAGGVTTEKGWRINWSPGYADYNQLVETSDGAEILSDRPFHPSFDPRSMERMAGESAKYFTTNPNARTEDRAPDARRAADTAARVGSGLKQGRFTGLSRRTGLRQSRRLRRDRQRDNRYLQSYGNRPRQGRR